MEVTADKRQGVYADVDALVKLSSLAGDFRLDVHKSKLSATDGGYRSNRRGRGMEFAEVRPYQAGDDIRNIDWRVTARTQETYTKLFQEEKERPIFVVVDHRPNMFFGTQYQFKSVLAAEISAFIAWCASKNGDRLGALIFSAQTQADLRAKQGKRAVVHFIQALIKANHALRSPVESGKYRFKDMLEETSRVVRSGSLVYIISDFHDLDSSANQSLVKLGKKADIEFIHISDPLEKSLPNCNFSLSDGKSRFSLSKNDKATRQAYEQSWARQKGIILDKASLARARYSEADTHQGLTQQLTTLFTRKK